MPPLRLADMLAAISVATDLGMGQPAEKAIRSCLVATDLARRMDLPGPEVVDTYYATLLRHLGCTASVHEELHLFATDELRVRPRAETADETSVRDMVGLLVATGRGAGLARPRRLARALAGGKKAATAVFAAVCEVGARLADRLELGPGVSRALFEVTERWDGKGGPRGTAGEDLPLLARIAEVATQAAIYDRAGGPGAAATVVRRRSGGWLDPAVAVFVPHAREILDGIRHADVWEAVLEAEPEPRRLVDEAGIDGLAAAFADMVDLKTPYTLNHSSEVASLTTGAAAAVGLDRSETADVRRAALLHDLGRVAVSGRTWEKPGPLTGVEWEQVRLHPYHTERILARSSALAPLARVAGMHHERQDGTGYHHGARSPEIPLGAGWWAWPTGTRP